MKVKDLIKLLSKFEPELEVFTLYNHGTVHKISKTNIVLVDDESTDKFTPRGIIFCSHDDDTVDFLVKNRKYKSVKHHD